MQPDLVVVTVAEAVRDYLSEPPVLVVEILSESTRAQDRGSKRLAYAEIGVANYWAVDLDEPSVLFLALEAGSYRQAAKAVGDESYEAGEPYPVTITPADLLVPQSTE